MSKIEEFFSLYSKKIKNYLPIVSRAITSSLKEVNPLEAKKFKKILKDFVSRGKLLRGSLYLLISHFYGKRKIDNLIDIALAIEINHSGLLIHDDIIDNSNLRRGKYTLHRYYCYEGEKMKFYNPKDYGINMAICFADICFFVAVLIMNNNFLNGKIKEKIISYYNDQLLKVGLAQMIDVKLGASSREPRLKEIFNLYKYKTANYSFVSPMVMGYLSAGKKDKKEIFVLEKIGYSLGLIFQIVDDLLGFLGNSKKIGKDIGSDVKENKKTLIRYFMFKKLKGQDLFLAKKCFGNKNLSLGKLNILREIYFKNKINILIDEIILKESKKAKNEISNLRIKDEHKKYLISFVDYLINRIK